MNEVEDRYPLSPMQQGMLFHHLSSQGTGVDLEQIVCRLPELIDAARLEEAFARVAARHPVLRSQFRWDDVEEPLQEVLVQAAIPVSVCDERGRSESERRAALEALLAADRREGFALDDGSPQRLTLLLEGEGLTTLVWSFHHILLDGRSFPIVLGELFEAYEALGSGRDWSPRRPRPYRDHIEFLSREVPKGAEAFWRQRMAGFRLATPLPAAWPAGSEPGPRGERGEISWRLSAERTRSLVEVAERGGFSLATLVQGAWAVLLSRYAGVRDVVFGATRAGRRSSIAGAEAMAGLFINTTPVRIRLDDAQPVDVWLREVHANERAVYPFEHAPLVEVQAWSEVPRGTPLFESIVIYDHATLDARMRERGPWGERACFELRERTSYPLALYAYGGRELEFKLAFDRERFDEAGLRRLQGHLDTLLEGIAARPGGAVGDLPLLTRTERDRLCAWNDTARPVPAGSCIHALFARRAARTPDATALVFRDERISYRALECRAHDLARRLTASGVVRGSVVGLYLERTPDLVVGALAILMAGGAYLPLDPSYPRERLAFMLDDADVAVLLSQASLREKLPDTRARVVCCEGGPSPEGASRASAPVEVDAEDLAYVIYTSGSTGRPKGVMVEHRNVVNFFTAMDELVPHDPPGVWLAVTSISFDISVLELLWTLCRGFEVVLRREPRVPRGALARNSSPISFSLFYFASESASEGEERGLDPYRLLLEGARFADARGFEAVWTPERHFHAFGGPYPSPAVLAAALAATTERVQIRAGSVVLPLHHPARVAEDWAVVDNLSRGRVSLAFASGWHPRDFLLRPEAFAERHKHLYDGIESVRRLWRGEPVAFPAPEGRSESIRTLPRPVQPELPVWVTIAGSPETWRRAGEIGANVLTHLLGQSFEELRERIAVYREARRVHGHDPDAGRVALMLHTFIGDDVDSVRERVREPMIAYLRSSADLIRHFGAAWTAFKKRADGSRGADPDVESIPVDELDDLLAWSFERYFESSALFGTPESCRERVEQFRDIGVDEIACLVDFGVAPDTVLAHLEHLDRLRAAVAQASADLDEAGEESLATQLRRHRVTHLQCTPSMAKMWMLDPASREALGSLDTLLLGGEALSAKLAAQLRELDGSRGPRILNLYGPTETTVWSAAHELDEADTGPSGAVVPIGTPIANTALHVLDDALRCLPVGVAGELFIGGAGVVRGYLARPELTSERFINDPFSPGGGGGRLYRTGDRVVRREDGSLGFLGRLDHQVKLRGHRVELGEVEAALREDPSVADAVVVLREIAPGDPGLVAYLIPRGESLDVASLRARLRETLPEVMVPAHFSTLESFPLTPNHKIDRNALPEVGALPRERSRPPANELEARIAGVWQEVLGLPSVGTEDNFFDLGGHSILAVKAHRQLVEALGQPLSIIDLFRFPTIRALAEFLGRGSTVSLQPGQERADIRREMLTRRRLLRTRQRRDAKTESTPE